MNLMLNKSEIFFGKEDKCLTKDELFRYIRNTASHEEKTRIERHLIECEHCFSSYEGINDSGNVEKVEKDLEDIRKEIRIRSGSGYVKRNNFRHYVSAAAVFIIAFCSLLLLNNKDKGNVIFQEYFEPYPNIFTVFRGSGSDNDIIAAFQSYDKGDYREARTIFEKILTSDRNDSRILFYYGICCLTLDEPNKAISSFNKMYSGSKDLLGEQSLFYKGLAYIKKNDFNPARQVFNRLINDNGIYKNKSLRVLREME